MIAAEQWYEYQKQYQHLMKATAACLVGAAIGVCINISNLGSIALPEGMRPYVTRVDFMIGVQLSYPNNCSVASCGDVTTINMIRNIRETELERRFFSELVRLGIPVSVESNDP